jgi:hypothetical protein
VRWLLNSVPTPVIGVIMLGATVLIALLASAWVRHRNLESVDTGGAMDPLGIVGLVYGLVAGLLIFGLWTNYSQARDTVTDEAGALEQVVLDIRPLPDVEQKRVEHAVSRYIDTVVTDEWHQMSLGHESVRAHRALDGIFLELEKAEPTTKVAEVWYSEATTKLNDAARARRLRIEAARREIPGPLRFFVFGGAVFPIGYVILIARRPSQTLLVAGVAILISSTLFLAVVLDYPFSGTVKASTAPFRQGFLAGIAP